jgi:hypothetical protein
VRIFFLYQQPPLYRHQNLNSTIPAICQKSGGSTKDEISLRAVGSAVAVLSAPAVVQKQRERKRHCNVTLPLLVPIHKKKFRTFICDNLTLQLALLPDNPNNSYTFTGCNLKNIIFRIS